MSPLMNSARTAGARIATRLGALTLVAGTLAAAPASGPLVGHDAHADPSVALVPGVHAVRLPGIGDDFTFVAGGELLEYGDGTARLLGVIARASDPDQKLAVDLRLSDRRRPGERAYPPLNSPNRGLAAHAYVDNGGTIDPSTWTYYAGMGGTLTGLDGLEGALLDLQRSGPAFQLGLGASNRNLDLGLAGGFAATLVRSATTGATLPASVAGADVCLNFGSVRQYATSGATADPDWTRFRGRQALSIHGLGTFDFVAGGQLVEKADGTAKLTGVVAKRRNPGKRFMVDIDFSGRVDPGRRGFPPLGSPKLALHPNAYADHGGVVDPDTWHYFDTTQGTLTGLVDLAGLDLIVERMGPAFQVGVGASGLNLGYGASGWLTIRPAQQLAETNGGTQATVGDMNLDLDDEGQGCADRALAQPGIGSSGGHALWLPGIGQDFVFLPGAQLVELADGTGRMIGVVARTSDDTQRFAVDVVLAGRVDPGEAGFPPAGSPKLELASSAYVGGGGPVDPASWHYYTLFDGTLTGLEKYAGALVQVTRRGPAFQVGLGANGKNEDYGGSGWITALVLAQPAQGGPWTQQLTGDFNVDVGGDCPECPDAAEGDAALGVSSAGDAAFWLPGIATDFDFEPGARLVERRDGTAALDGILASVASPSLRLAVHVDFTNRVNPGGFGFVPVGSPKKELPASVYVENGGPIDTASWRYYLDFQGTLTGLGDLAGALYRIERRGPAFQVGVGANGRNLRFGASGWITAEALRPPDNGSTLPQTIAGDVNLDTESNCP
jgi:hypothetical protein